ncbi:hypothetical protein GQ457_05G020500 [Hibiscus cannabinus]
MPVVEAAFEVKSYAPPKKPRPHCTHCHLIGHTKEKCYKLHGYPPGYVSKARQSYATHVNAASTNVADSLVSHDSFSVPQYQNLIAMLTSQLQAVSSADLPSLSFNLAINISLPQASHTDVPYQDFPSSTTIEFHADRNLSADVMTEETSTEVLVEDGFNEAVHEEPTHVETTPVEVVTNEILAKYASKPLTANGPIDKARLVAKGFTQIEGVDYTDTFSPVAKMTSFKIFLALVACKQWHLLQLDVNNDFLNGILNEELYMKLPLGYKAVGSGSSNLVYKLNKSIYGLKQASRQWFGTFSQVVLKYGFIQSPSDHSLFVKSAGDEFVALLVYVDDIILVVKNLGLLHDVQVFLKNHFKLKELDSKSLAKKPADLLILSPHKLSKNEGELLADLADYRQLIGRLLYLTHTRHDVTYVVHLLSQFVAAPRKPHLMVVYHLLSYIKNAPGLGLFFPSSSNLQLSAFVDSDYSSCPDSRRLTTGYYTYLSNCLISWKSKKQTV